MKQLAIRLGTQTTRAKLLVTAQPADCVGRCDAVIPAPVAFAHRVMTAPPAIH
ncbi:MAG: hypothetical protein ABI144_07235 [Gallionella sp.]